MHIGKLGRLVAASRLSGGLDQFELNGRIGSLNNEGCERARPIAAALLVQFYRRSACRVRRRYSLRDANGLDSNFLPSVRRSNVKLSQARLYHFEANLA